MKIKLTINILVVAIASIYLVTASPALALTKVYSPNINKGELELEYYGSRTYDKDPDKNNLQSHEAEIDYGLTNNVLLKLSGTFTKLPDQSVKSSGLEFGVGYKFFEQGEKWVDVGVQIAYIKSTHSIDANAMEAKLLLEKQWGQFLHRSNIIVEQEVGGGRSRGGPEREFLWSSRYLYNIYFQPGFEIQSEFGKASEHLNYRDQQHYVGPAVYGQILRNLKYEFAYFRGITAASSDSAVRAFLEYEIYF